MTSTLESSSQSNFPDSTSTIARELSSATTRPARVARRSVKKAGATTEIEYSSAVDLEKLALAKPLEAFMGCTGVGPHGSVLVARNRFLVPSHLPPASAFLALD